MSRPSKLHLLARLARHEESRALRHLGEARSAVQRIEDDLADLHQAVSASQRSARQGLRLTFAAADLLANERHRESLRRSASKLTQERETGLELEEKARQAMAQARLRVRAIESAIERRAERQRVQRERLRTRRIDEAVRSARARADQEEHDAF